jgi:perosamine synthetase
MVTAVWHSSYGLSKSQMRKALDLNGIETRPFFNPLSSLQAYAALPEAKRAAQQNKVAYTLSPLAINLPSALCLTKTDVEYVCFNFKKALGQDAPISTGRETTKDA